MNPTSFQDIKDGLCRWPLGEPEEIDFKFCGRNTNEGFVYCQAHHKQAYQPLSKVRERRKIKKKFRISQNKNSRERLKPKEKINKITITNITPLIKFIFIPFYKTV